MIFILKAKLYIYIRNIVKTTMAAEVEEILKKRNRVSLQDKSDTKAERSVW